MQEAKKAATRKRLQNDRMAELLDIAAEVFIAEGFAATSTNKIAKLANASKTTFYSRFPTKEDLFLAVIERRMDRVFEQVAKFPESSSLRETLRTFGANLLGIALSPEQMSLVRLVSMESGKYPALARRFYERGPKRGETSLATYLLSQIESGKLKNDKPRTMARHLISLLTGSPVRWFVMGFETEPITRRALLKHRDEVVDAFLRAYSPAWSTGSKLQS